MVKKWFKWLNFEDQEQEDQEQEDQEWEELKAKVLKSIEEEKKSGKKPYKLPFTVCGL